MVTIEEIALNLGVKPQTVRSWIKRQTFPARQIIVNDIPDWYQWADWWKWDAVLSWAELMDRPAPEQPGLLAHGVSEYISLRTGAPIRVPYL